MLARLLAPLALLLCVAAPPAQSSFTIDLIWADTGTPTLTLEPGAKNASFAGTPCAKSPAPEGRCLTFQFTAEERWGTAITRLGWNAESSGLGIAHIPNFSVGPVAIVGFGGLIPKIRDANTAFSRCPIDECDTIVGSFGGFGNQASGFAPGVYTIGSIHLDASGVRPGTHLIQNFQVVEVGGVRDPDFQLRNVQLNPARIVNVVPEPSAAILYLSGMALWVAQTRRVRRQDRNP